MSGAQRRQSKLEVDDPKHCKECGGELPTGPLESEDKQGRPEIWSSKLGKFVTIELCPDCWTNEQLKKLRRQCQERYDGNLPEVLEDVKLV